MKKVIVTTTIYQPSQALLKFISFKDWDIVIVGDKKTPHDSYVNLEKEHDNVKYLSPEIQDELFPDLSQEIGWNKIQRRSIGYLYVYVNNYQIIASVDDDNIPFDNWGKDILINNEVSVYYYKTDCLSFLKESQAHLLS